MRKRKLSPPKRLQPDATPGEGVWGDMHRAKRESGLGRSTIAKLIAEEKVRSAKIGKRRLIHIASLLGHIDSQATGPAGE
jgi:hypothetical protein